MCHFLEITFECLHSLRAEAVRKCAHPTMCIWLDSYWSEPTALKDVDRLPAHLFRPLYLEGVVCQKCSAARDAREAEREKEREVHVGTVAANLADIQKSMDLLARELNDSQGKASTGALSRSVSKESAASCRSARSCPSTASTVVEQPPTQLQTLKPVTYEPLLPRPVQRLRRSGPSIGSSSTKAIEQRPAQPQTLQPDTYTYKPYRAPPVHVPRKPLPQPAPRITLTNFCETDSNTEEQAALEELFNVPLYIDERPRTPPPTYTHVCSMDSCKKLVAANGSGRQGYFCKAHTCEARDWGCLNNDYSMKMVQRRQRFCLSHTCAAAGCVRKVTENNATTCAVHSWLNDAGVFDIARR